MKKAFCIFIFLTLLFAFCACSQKTETAETTAKNNQPTALPTRAQKTQPQETAAQSLTQPNEIVTQKSEEMTAEQIVALYKEIMDTAKKERPGFTRLDYQELLSDSQSRVISEGKGLVNLALNFAGNFMKTKEQAQKKPTKAEKGSDMKDFPVKNTSYGCLLENAEGVRKAKYEEIGNGRAKITIILKAENNPEPCSAGATRAVSYHGSVCSPISKKEIDEDLSGGLFKSISYSLRYHDCTTELIFNTENKRIISQTQTNYVTITGQGTIGFVTLKIDRQELINHVDIINLIY